MNLLLFLPETVLILWILGFLVLSLLKNQWSGKALTVFAALGATAAFAASIITFNHSGFLFLETYRTDLLSQCFKALIASGLLFTVFFSRDLLSIPEKRNHEYFLFLFSSTLGMMMLPSSMNLLTLYVSMELSSYSLYLLTALRSNRRNAESSIKYLLLGAAASGVFLWGSSLVVGLSGSASLQVIAMTLSSGHTAGALFLGTVFILFAFLFKLSAAPLHFWTPDVYESAATPVASFIATSSKAAAVAVLVRFLSTCGISPMLISTLGVFAFLSMTLGNTVALVQKDVKRLLAYSSIAQAGYLLVGLLSGSAEGYAASLFYAMAYLLMNAGVFLVVLTVAQSSKQDNPQLSHFDGLAERSPKLALLLLLSLLSLAGIPPLVGFTGKWILFSAAMDQGHWFLVLWAVLNSVVSLFYYLTLVKHAYLEKPSTPTPLVVSASRMALTYSLMTLLVGLGLFPNLFIEIAQKALSLTILS